MEPPKWKKPKKG